MSEVAEEIAVETAPETPEAVETPAPETVETPALTPEYDPTEDPRVLDLIRTQAGQISEQQIQALIAQARESAGGEAPVLSTDAFFDELGNFDPAAFAAYQAQRDEQLATRFEQMFNKVAQPLAEREQAETNAEGERRIQDMVADDISRNGDFPADETGKSAAKDLIRPLSDALFPSIAQTYGVTPRAAELAVSKASSLIRQVVEQSGKAAVAAHVNRNAQLAGAHGEPGSGSGSGLETNGRPEGGYAPGELSLKWGANAERIRAAS